MTADRAPGKLVSWIRSKTRGLATAVVFICLSLAGCAYINTPVKKVETVFPLAADLAESVRRGEEHRDEGNDKEAARHFLMAMETHDRIETRLEALSGPLSKFARDHAAKAQYELGRMYQLGKMTPSDVDEEINEMNKEVDSYLHKKAQEIEYPLEYPHPNPSNNGKRMYRLYVLAAESGESGLPEAQSRLGIIFLNNTEFMEKTFPSLNLENLCQPREDSQPRPAPDMYAKAAFDWFQKAAEPRVSDHLDDLGEMYLKNPGDSGSLTHLGRMYQYQPKRIVGPRDPKALNYLGLMYLYDLVSDDQSGAFLR